MLRYTLNRLLLMIPTLVGVAVLVFFMLRIVPGDVVEIKLRGDGGNVRNPDSQFDFIGRAYFAPLALMPAAAATRWLSEIWIGASVWYGRRTDVPYDHFPISTAGAVAILPPVFGGGNRFVPNGELLKWALEVNAPIGPLSPSGT